SRSSSSAAAATKMHPPGSPGSVAQRRQFSNSAFTRGSPRGCRNEGASTLATKRSEAVRSISSCSSSFEPKWANSPLFDIPSSPASPARLSPSSPSRAASRNAVSRMRSRVCRPFAMPIPYAEPAWSATKKARPVVFSSIPLVAKADRRRLHHHATALGRRRRARNGDRRSEPSPLRGCHRRPGEDAHPQPERGKPLVPGQPFHVPPVDLLRHHRRLEQRKAAVEQHRRKLPLRGARILLHHLRPREAAGQEGGPERERLQRLGIPLLHPVPERGAQIHQRIP